jgi:hypothetical protein
MAFCDPPRRVCGIGVRVSGLRKSAKRFSARNPLTLLGIDHVYDFGLIQFKIIVI